MIDFVYRLRTASSKRHYFWREGGVFDLLGCVPGLRIFRLFRILRAGRIIRRLGGPRVLRDMRPVTRGGRIVGTLMLTVGVALFATFSGFLANAFLRNNGAAPPRRPPTAASTRRCRRSSGCSPRNRRRRTCCVRGSPSPSQSDASGYEKGRYEAAFGRSGRSRIRTWDLFLIREAL